MAFNYDPKEMEVLKKYRIILPAGYEVRVGGRRVLAADEIRTSVLKSPQDSPLGMGPIMEPEVIDKLLQADLSPDKHWLDWIFFQAGGGERAVERGGAALQQIKDRFIDERANGFENPTTREFLPKVDQAEAERRWETALPKFKDLLKVCDQDSVSRLNTFGYFRKWPGHNRIYENVVAAVLRFQKLEKKVLRMNKEMEREGAPEVPSTPQDIKTWEEMNKISDKTERYFASKVARDDKRLSGHPARKDHQIYDDDYLSIRAPLTWAAAVHFGYPGWSWANREAFDEVLSTEGSDYRNEWKTLTSKGNVYVYITFKAPVPIWVSRYESTFKRFQLTNLAVQLTANNMQNLTDTDSLEVWDEENRHSLTIRDVKDMILAEPTRQDPPDEEIPLKRGANAYATPEEAQAVVAHLDAGLAAMVEWAQTFDPATIKQDALKLD